MRHCKELAPAIAPSVVPSDSNQQIIPGSITTPLETRASCHFLSNYVLIPNKGSSAGFLEFILPLVQQNDTITHFKYAFDACALASLSTRVGAGKDLEKLALAQYTRALAAVSMALKDPGVAKLDASLAAVFLLGLFEHITAKHIMAWGMHIEGAVRLAGTGGDNQSSLRIAVQMQMITFMLSTGTAPSVDVLNWADGTAGDDCTLQCMKLSIRAADLGAKISRLLIRLPRTSENVDSIQGLIRQCKDLDREFTKWASNLSEHFQRKTATWVFEVPLEYAKAEAFPGRMDVYQDLWASYMWNMMRCSRIILASKVIRSAAWICCPMNYRTTPEFALASATCTEMIADIIASIPYHLGWSANNEEPFAQATSSGFACGNNDAQKSLAGFFLTSPLACVQGQDFTTDSQRAWVQGRLEYIAKELGVRYAGTLTKLNLRIPSMLIRRDRLVADLCRLSPDFEMSLMAKTTTPAENSPESASEEIIAVQKRIVQCRIARLVEEVMGASGQVNEASARGWLQI